ncbi:17342_t:CDS:10 [Funneliformis geosporum]|uniref:DNA-directed RNA polymerase subunit n=1 Tax=Funneliformis geosporum TaxID=1117311 RepID=A0A9W4WS30_9GLOM|nr:17342_t:CDS:10 [Funneliformis geosporum]
MSEIKISKEVNKIKEEIKSLNLGQISELIDGLKEDYNIQEQVAIQSTATQTEEKVEEKGKVSVQEAVKDLKGEDINIVRAKKLTEEGEKIILADIPRDKAEEFQKKMKEKGAKQKLSYHNFLYEKLPKLLNFYFPAESNDYNNNIKIKIEEIECHEPEISEEEAKAKQKQKVDFCNLPKINPQGTFIINGHEKVVVLQSVRAPTIYHFVTEKSDSFYSEIIPFKDILKTFAVNSELLEHFFNPEDLNLEDYSATKPLETGENLPHFLFTKRNSYFDIGKLGRRKFNQKIDIFQYLPGQTLAEDLLDKNGKLILKKNTILEGEKLQLLQQSFQNKKLVGFTVPHSNHDLYVVKIQSPKDKKIALPLISTEKISPEEKTYFDLADLICAVSSHINLYYGLGKIEKEEEKDKLENQIVRRVGDLVYNIFNDKLGGFLQVIDNKYLSNISQLKKADLIKIPGLTKNYKTNLNDFDNYVRHFFNNSALVQLQNQNNPLARASYSKKLSVLGRGGFKSANTTLEARNINPSYCGRYDLVETPEGQRVGLVHNLTISAEINDEGQVATSYYLVKEGIITDQLVYLTSEEEGEQYVTHPNIKISEKNEILDALVPVVYQGNFSLIPKEKVNYIYSSFHHLNSLTTAAIPFFSHNDATRILMAANMQRQALPLLVNQEPLVASGIEASLLKNSPLAINAEEKGEVEYVDSQKIIIKETNKKEKVYKLKQLVASNKNTLDSSFPLVKKGDKVEKGQIIACDKCFKNKELALGYNLRVAYLCLGGYNYEDAIIVNENLIKKDILTSFFVKKHTIIRRNTKHGPEIFTSSFPHHSEKKQFPHLGKDGIVKIGSKVKGNDILVGKLTPDPRLRQETEEELLLMSILGEKAQKFINSSLHLPHGEEGIAGDKLTTRFGSKGVVGKIVPEVDMPYDKEGKTFDIILNPLGIPTRMNIGQLLETILSLAAYKTNTKFLVRPFNNISLETIKEIISEAKIKNFGLQKLFDGKTGLPFQQPVFCGFIYTFALNHKVTDKIHARGAGPEFPYSLIYQQPLKGRAQNGGQRAHGAPYNLMEMMGPKSDDIHKRRLIQNELLFGDRQTDLRSSQNESFNLLIQYLRGIGFDLTATDNQEKNMTVIKSVKITWLSPRKIEQLSFGKITNHKTINTRTLKPELGGLFDPRIFGPFLNYECYCGKYKGKQNKGQKLTNILIFKNLATNLSKLLKISTKNLENIIYFQNYVVIDNEITEDKNLEKNVINQAKKLIEKISEKEKNQELEINTVFLEDYLAFIEKHRQVKIGIGTEAFQRLLKEINIEEELAKTKEVNKKGILKGKNESIKFLEVTKLANEETIATSRDNKSYQKVIFINERLNYYLELNKKLKVFFSEIIHNEKKRLQKAVDHLIHGSTNKRNDSKSLSQSLSGKEGILRRHSLGKRVDYSARSVIIPNPSLSLDQVGLPITIALTLFKPFIIQKILKEKNVFTLKEAEQMISREDPIVFSSLSKIIQNHPILINRAPSLHRLSIQGFYPKLTLDKAIGLHPKITIPLNADFDGDQTAVHLPLTKKAREEVKDCVLSPHHILDPKNGQLITIPSQDMILGKLIFNQILPSTFSFYINDLRNYNEEEGE